VDANGNAQHAGDMAAQLELSLDNLEAVLAAADMNLANIIRLSVYTTDFDEFVKHWASLRPSEVLPIRLPIFSIALCVPGWNRRTCTATSPAQTTLDGLSGTPPASFLSN
jgi:hypothetical protein